MSASDRERWDSKYEDREPASSVVKPDDWLVEALQLIEAATGDIESGRRSLDLACGLGHNAIWLARQGWQSDAVDISAKGVELARQAADTNQVDVNWIVADIDDWLPQPAEYDLAVVFRFLDRETVPRIIRTGLRSGGWLVYETFASGQCDRDDTHISNPAFTLSPGELLTLFPDFEPLEYREEVLSDRTVQRFVGQRQANAD